MGKDCKSDSIVTLSLVANLTVDVCDVSWPLYVKDNIQEIFDTL
jgi:hypothetical protein